MCREIQFLSCFIAHLSHFVNPIDICWKTNGAIHLYGTPVHPSHKVSISQLSCGISRRNVPFWSVTLAEGSASSVMATVDFKCSYTLTDYIATLFWSSRYCLAVRAIQCKVVLFVFRAGLLKRLI